jgi:hypothetical protein
MPSDSEQRIIRLESLILPILRRLAAVEIAAGRAGQNQGGGSGGGGTGIAFFKITQGSPGIAAGTATSPTSGSALYEQFNGTNVSDTADTETLWNYHVKGFSTGAHVPGFTWQGAWWIFDVDDCLNLF